jgi:hypothetical protein
MEQEGRTGLDAGRTRWQAHLPYGYETSGKSITPNPSPRNGLQRPGQDVEGIQDLVAISSDLATISRRGPPHGWSDHPPAKERHVYNMKKSSAQKVESPSQLIDARIKELGDWRGKTLSRLRALIKQADPEVVEEWKWRKPSHPGVPVWSHQGGICTGETYKSVVKLTFFKGASLKDPSGLFNSSLEGNTRRAIDFHEDDEIDEKAFATLIRAAVSLNESSSR